ncbi:MAG: tRNA (N(6)-L-threonylcarbamoyladenosine(37)-C(2))-methylthiotransferase MtaB [Dehalococcoidales bacterium]|nr:tRNA (N(6)-L-threonylcarbamoyladenosine(37)-C(2))-methylthiotransferase MtaB [Dehalococcoidales bacterium]
MKVALDTLGCKLNQAETEKLARQFLEAGHCLVSPETSADVYILNTCTVTSNADGKARRWLRLAHRRNPGARMVVTGCYAQRRPDELAQMEGVCLVVGNNEKPHLLRLLQDAGCPVSPAATSGYSPVLRTRTFINIQDGCSRSCTYCIVPRVRGEEKSRLAEDVIAEVKKRVDEGYQEVILTGTEIGAYYGGLSFTGLLGRILTETSVPRLRLSSLQPQEISSELLELWRDSRLCPHFHLSLQSGSNRILRRMRRAYSSEDYERIVRVIRDMVPDAAITTDIIVGFPSETEEEFVKTYDFCRKLQFARIHVFSYSSRPDTEASRMSGQISLKVKGERSRKMIALAEQSADNFQKRFLGKVMPVLWETKSNGIWSGFTGNYIKAYTKSDDDLSNKVLAVKLDNLT